MNSISFIIPVYNIDIDFVQYCFDSLIKQIEETDEIIIVDDGSTVDVAKYIDRFERNNVYVMHQENAGVSVARNVGLSLAKNKWICFIDPDDFVANDSIEEARKYLESGKNIYIFDYFVVQPDKTLKRYSFFEENQKVSKSDIHMSLLDNIGKSIIGCGVPWAHIYNREFLNGNNLVFDKRCIRMQDNIFNTYAIEAAETFEVVNHAFYAYRFEHCAGFLKKFNKNRLDYFPYLGQLKMNFYNSHDYGDEVNRAVVNCIYGFNFYIINDYCICPDEDDKEKRHEELEKIRKNEQFEYLRRNIKRLSLPQRICVFLVDKNLIILYMLLKAVKKYIRSW